MSVNVKSPTTIKSCENFSKLRISNIVTFLHINDDS